MRKRSNYFRVGIAAAVCLLAASAVIAVTPAGTQIQSTGTARYYSTDGVLMPTANSNTVTTTVRQVASVSVSPASDTKELSSGDSMDFALSVTNAGNGSDTFDLSAVSQNGLTVVIYKDDNGDGLRQSTEITQAAATGALAAGSLFKCFVNVQLPSQSTESSDTIVFTAKSRYDTAKTSQSTLTVQEKAPNTGPYILSWLINGYHPNTDAATRLSKDYIGGEAGVMPTEGSVSGGKTWFRLDSPAAYVDLAKTFSNQIYCAAYAHAYIYSPSTQTVNLQMGSDDGIKVWMNGSVAWNNDVRRPHVADQDKTTVNLSMGWNRLLVKISQSTKTWGYSVKLCDASGNAVPGLVYALAR